MITLEQKLKQLNEISNNPNLNGGIWNSLNLFISTSDDILKDSENLKNLSISEEKKTEIINDLTNIRTEFQQKCGVKGNTDLEKKKNSRCNGHIFKSKVSKFLEGYKGRFLI